MKIVSYKDLKVWKKARSCAGLVYENFSDIRDFAFRDQIRKAAVSVMNNIAEGYGRRNDNELRYFLRIANGSCIEVQSMVYLASDLRYIDEDTLRLFLDETDQISKMINSFISTINLKNNSCQLSAIRY